MKSKHRTMAFYCSIILMQLQSYMNKIHRTVTASVYSFSRLLLRLHTSPGSLASSSLAVIESYSEQICLYKISALGFAPLSPRASNIHTVLIWVRRNPNWRQTALLCVCKGLWNSANGSDKTRCFLYCIAFSFCQGQSDFFFSSVSLCFEFNLQVI